MTRVITENVNPKTKDIDIISTIDLVNKINDEDEVVAKAVRKQNFNISKAIDIITANFLKNGKLFYFGAGTSGRLGVLDASECPPTFGVEPDMVIGIIAGGDSALRNAIEGAEDDFELGLNDAQILKENDTCVLISASGNPNYLLGVDKIAKENKAKVIAITCNPKGKILEKADVGICVEVGPEVISGSSRLKAGTAQKMVLNMLSTGSMIKIGKTYENLMIDVKATNEKLKKRAIQIVLDLTNKDEKYIKDTLISCDWKVKVAVLSILKKIPKEQALELLNANSGVLRKALK